MEGVNVAIVTAAGSGLRMGGDLKKQFLQLDGLPILIRAIIPFVESALIDEIVVTAPADELKTTEQLIREHHLGKRIKVVSGGKTRQESVYNGLQACPQGSKWVFIHDGVRPLLQKSVIDELAGVLKRCPAVIPVAKVKPSIKEVKDGLILRHVPRENLVQALTPQAFEYGLICDAHQKARQEGFEATDDAALVQHYGAQVRALESDALNIKITDEADLLLATLLIKHYTKDLL
ncbi:MAG TPA: 2-C-methyl-D-erythritol 4-phosphate cytidylyltransferase [Candidatus Cloacimonetes bacterium]|jgi:2-C-methyl-D-erythritol 4-phosphate cytidylyltransferase|nr:2-C-methyl-D-erythritol 4-phosphate cytidylyltransferase [Candidatus Cloacimonas sp.]HHZ14970.1 2-C-methyl-D-erythritol 4-phosphate cytidylyltransferase [Candidatus Cloacimonadota bacterium]